MGQFSGRTHATKVEDRETLLRHAVTVFLGAPYAERASKAKTAASLAARLLAARLKHLNASLALLDEDKGKHAPADRENRIAHLRVRKDNLIAGGVAAILKEFGAASVISFLSATVVEDETP